MSDILFIVLTCISSEMLLSLYSDFADVDIKQKQQKAILK